jgi:aminoglycoside phosphotransferase (APT) family kinase protein
LTVAEPADLEPSDVAPIRPGENFDQARVATYLQDHISGLAGPMEGLQFPGGHANLTYLLRFADRELVLRRPPLGPVAPKSHDMAREYQVLKGIEDRFRPAPKAYLLCEDPSIIGATFLIMERMQGVVIRFSVPPEIDRHPDGRRRASFALIDAMADLHDVDYVAAGLADLGKPEGFVERQVRGWKGRWDRSKDVELPMFDELYQRLMRTLPPSPAPTLVHNDLKLDNTMMDPANPDHVVSILDWDMTTLGDPLVDLGTLLGYWSQSDDPPERGATAMVTAQPGFPTRQEIAERYADRRRVDLGTIAWYEAFAMWKTAVVLQQIYIRFVRGQTQDERFKLLGDRVRVLVDIAAQVADRA